jgi:WD40 repeat protein
LLRFAAIWVTILRTSMTDEHEPLTSPERARELAKLAIARGYALRRRRRSLITAPAVVLVVVGSVLGIAQLSSSDDDVVKVTNHPASTTTTTPSTPSTDAGQPPPAVHDPSSTADRLPAVTQVPTGVQPKTRSGRVLYATPTAIVSINADGSGEHALLRLQPREVRPSPSGDHLAIVRVLDDGTKELVVANDDGSDVRRVAVANAFSLSWSPDGRRIAYVSGEFAYDVFVAAVGSSSIKRVTTDGNVTHVAWSPTGDRLAYISRSGVFTITPEGAEPVRLTPPDMEVRDVAWSPNGRTIGLIAFQLVGSSSSAWAVEADGSGLRRLGADCVEHVAGWTWSPDGALYACASGHGIVVAGIDGSSARQISDHDDDRFPAWSPDGKTIAFVREQKLLMVVDAGGGRATRLGSFELFDGSEPAWWPR